MVRTHIFKTAKTEFQVIKKQSMQMLNFIMIPTLLSNLYCPYYVASY